MTTYTAKAGDTIDWLCWKYYGVSSGAVELVLNANPRLSLNDPYLPAGTVITLPNLPKPVAVAPLLRIWG